MRGTTNYLKNSHVCQGGRITPWGSFRILVNGCQEPDRDESKLPIFLQTGLEMWSKKLIGYARRNCRVEVGRSVVRVLKEEKLLKRIPFDQFRSVHSHEEEVLRDGHLHSTIYEDDSYKVHLLRCLEKAAEGKDPGYYDNSTFVQIAKEYSGQTVIFVDFAVISGNGVVYTKDGVGIPSKAHKPLAFKKWGKTPNLEPRGLDALDDLY